MPDDSASVSIRRAYADAADAFVQAVASVAPEQWEQPGLGEWTVRELTAHTLRALITVEQYLAGGIGSEAEPITVESPEDYFVRVLHGDPDVHIAVAARGRAGGAELTDPAATVAATAERVLALVATSPDDAVCITLAGAMRLIDYLPTRVVELVVHTADIGRATGVAVPIGTPALQVAVRVLAGVGTDTLARVVLALTGREPLPPGFNVLDVRTLGGVA